MRLALIPLPDIDMLSEVNGRESRRSPPEPNSNGEQREDYFHRNVRIKRHDPALSRLMKSSE